ncbi:P1 family peptidase [Brevibacterium casei]|uniref:Esterase n=2 Tax=Brevibacterium casei TaxID=33889 RepID=A0A269ZDQ9_9MICO|nr:P1 family peptidase [Brevibacterium casei]MBE4694973.1 peptidase S58 family protein [Brevibacterium casei]MBY3578095.1 peptidase S58 family protein [Brevibacterium casei]MCT1448188.1 P1 family peptidase [Brevibacterium casei]MCT1765646.1 P1 family peptidase [Brevibacterium casei]MCT2184442.1 P1 family peptidase [Brevibacterium casei]
MTPTRGRGILDVPGLALGHAGTLTRDRLTGVSVVLPPAGSTVGVDVRGGGPATHETDVLSPTAHGSAADALVLTGGSAIGLRSVAGVSDALAEAGRGFPAPRLPGTVIPLVPAAAIFDLGRGAGPVAPPTAAEGAAAAQAALAALTEEAPTTPVRGSVGVGIGARAGVQTLRSSLGSVSIRLSAGYTVSALVVANPFGTIGTEAGTLWAGPLLEAVGWDLPPLPSLPVPDLEAPLSAQNTTLAIIATDARLDRAQVTALAAGGHPGIARAVRPSHTLIDGDTVFAVATGARALPEDPAEALPAVVEITAAAADAVTLAVLDALTSASPLAPAWEQPPTLVDIAPDFTAAFADLP